MTAGLPDRARKKIPLFCIRPRLGRLLGAMQIELIPTLVFLSGLIIPVAVLVSAAIDTARAEEEEAARD